MGNGINIVFQSNGRGGLLQSSDDRWIINLIAVALLDGDSRNPFQSIGLYEGIIFENPDEELWNDLKIQIVDIFDRLERDGLAKLDDRPDNLRPFQSGEGSYGLKIYFINLEKNAPGEGQLFAGSNGFYGTAT